MTDTEIAWSLYLKTLYKLYDVLEESFFDEMGGQKVAEATKQYRRQVAKKHYEKLATIVSKVEYDTGKKWNLPIILWGKEGNA